MRTFHVPWRARPGRGRAGGLGRVGRTSRVALAVAVVLGLTLVTAAQHSASAATGAPYGAAAAAVPGTVYAANYDTGGQGVAYNVTSANGSANGYRTDGIDLEATADTTSNTGAGADDIGWTTAGQWFNYTVNVATAGTYTVAFRVSSPYGITDALHIANASGTNLSGSVTIPNTGGYQTWTTVDASVTLPAGQQTLRVAQDSNGWNFHFMTFTLTSGGGGTPPPSGDAPFGGAPAAVPGTVQAANYDTGGQGVAYNVTAANGTANSYRSDGVDLEATADTSDTGPAGGGYDLGWTGAGQWFTYTVEVATAGTYTVSFRVAAPAAVADALHIDNSSGINLTGSVAIAATGSYQTWATITATVTLPAGQQTLTVDQDAAGWNLHYLAFTQGSGGGAPPGGGTGPTEYCGTQDLALDQPTTASSTQDATDYPASDATDGDPGTRWSSAASDPQWLEVDLGSPQQICSVGIQWEAAYASAFSIQVSNDNATWTTVYSTTAGTGGEPDVPDHHDRPLHPDVRHRPRHPVGRLDLRVRRLRPDHHRPGHRRQRQRRQRRLPLGRLHRAGRHPRPAGAQHHGPGRGAGPGGRRRHLVLHRPHPGRPQPLHPRDQPGGRPERGR